MTSDAVLIFDGAGRVLLANDEASELLGRGKTDMAGSDVRLYFPPALGVAPDDPFVTSSLPFALDGSSAHVMCAGSDGRLAEIVVRADRVNAPGETYLLVASPANDADAAGREHDRLLDELQRANRRLSGTLDIVLSTIDSEDVGSLFTNVIEEITGTMEATGTLLYLAEGSGFHLHGVSSALKGASLPRYLTFGVGLERSTGALRLRVLEPTSADLRRGRLTSREVIDEDSRVVRRISARKLPPFASFLLTPVRFGGHTVAVIEVGWDRARQTRKDDARLLDAVGRYLSVQIAGALTTLRRQRTTELAEFGTKLRGLLLEVASRGAAGSHGAAGPGVYAGSPQDAAAPAGTMAQDDPFAEISSLLAQALDCTVVPLRENPYQSETVVAPLPVSGDRALPMSLDKLEATGRGSAIAGSDTAVMRFGEGTPLGDWLAGLGEPSQGALVDLGTIEDRRGAILLLRPADTAAFDEIELSFLRRLADDARDIAQRGEARDRDRHIAQALQTGMRNELQEVAGISARGIYSSATQSAFVGGDFYDLIRLPNRRACVIMGDVSGKGVEAASVSAAVKTALGAYSWEGLRPARMVRLLNEFLLGFSRLETFATLFVGIVDLAAARLTYCSAGHPPAILVHAAAGELVTLDVQSGVVGAFSDMEYRNGQVDIAPGDVLLLYTDGTTEARAPEGAFFGEDGLREAVMQELPLGYDHLLDRLLARLDDFTDRHLDDDVAMVSLRFDAVGGRPAEG